MYELSESIKLIKQVNDLTNDLLKLVTELNKIEVSDVIVELGDVIESNNGDKYMVTKDELTNKYALLNLSRSIVCENKYDTIAEVVDINWLHNSKYFKLIKKNI